MLRKLHILNYAIIDEIEIVFSKQLNVITGETGAGKSILMGALSLILGERADTSILQNRDKKCFIEGYFDVEDKAAVKSFLEVNELDVDNELVLRREIGANGKSRGFINDTPATLFQLKELASLLVDLHQQFDTLELGDSDFQREVLDALALNNDTLLTYQQHYRKWQQTKKELDELQEKKSGFYKELDYQQFLFDELNDLNLAENELEDLETELKMLSNSEGIKSALTSVYAELKEQEQPIVQQLKIMANQLQGFSQFQKDLPGLIERITSTQVELQDIAEEVDRLNDHVSFDQSRIDVINERLSVGYKLLKKHGVQTTNELRAIKNELEGKLETVLQIDDLIAEKEKGVKELQEKADKIAKTISDKRKKQSQPFADKVNVLLSQVGMPNARLKVQIENCSLSLFGCDGIEFLFDANKSNRFEPIRKVASGGELSRLMLCIKSLVAESIDLPTLIFDEIDTGISGEAAKQVGMIMKELANTRQVICITHQPQIAGKAVAHFYVYKEVKGNAVKTNIRQLSQDERITNIAQMLSGEKPTAAALENAREMVM
jgi:DNA repair protein RecN (Recombination protein N)